MFCSVKWRVVDEFLNSSITDIRLVWHTVWHRRHKSKRFIFDPWDIVKCGVQVCKYYSAKMPLRSKYSKFTFLWILKTPKDRESKKENSIKARLCVFAELSETTTCVKITSNCYSHAIIDLFENNFTLRWNEAVYNEKYITKIRLYNFVDFTKICWVGRWRSWMAL